MVLKQDVLIIIGDMNKKAHDGVWVGEKMIEKAPPKSPEIKEQSPRA